MAGTKPYEPLKTRMIEVIGKYLRICYDDENGKFTCENVAVCPLGTELEDTPNLEELSEEYGVEVISSGLIDKYNTKSGSPEPGDMFWLEVTSPFFHWDNHPGRELHVILPNGHEWNIDSRARNCTLPKERTHRCWVRKGTPPQITVSKGDADNPSCTAGAGSIRAGDYHGFLRNGEFTKG